MEERKEWRDGKCCEGGRKGGGGGRKRQGKGRGGGNNVTLQPKSFSLLLSDIKFFFIKFRTATYIKDNIYVYKKFRPLSLLSHEPQNGEKITMLLSRLAEM